MPSVWAIGDIHGQLAKLEKLLSALPRQAGDTTVFLGDYLDRGPDSAGVVRRVLAEYDAAPDRIVLLWGNHEDLAAANFGLPRPSTFQYDALDWFRNGGDAALQSWEIYGADQFTAACPPDLARLLSLTQTFWRPPAEAFPDLAHVIYVHAGVVPGEQPEEASGNTLLWIREDFLNYRDRSGRLVVHGHTPFKDVRVRPDKIGIDTGAVYGGSLTALQLPERRVYQIDPAGRIIDWELPLA